MDREQARRVQAGDVAVYRRARRRVVAVFEDGFWAPYFELEGAGVVGHALVDGVEIQPAGGAQRARVPRRSGSQWEGLIGKLVVPELGMWA
jgi:hypothetical protein